MWKRSTSWINVEESHYCALVYSVGPTCNLKVTQLRIYKDWIELASGMWFHFGVHKFRILAIIYGNCVVLLLRFIFQYISSVVHCTLKADVHFTTDFKIIARIVSVTIPVSTSTFKWLRLWVALQFDVLGLITWNVVQLKERMHLVSFLVWLQGLTFFNFYPYDSKDCPKPLNCHWTIPIMILSLMVVSRWNCHISFPPHLKLNWNYTVSQFRCVLGRSRVLGFLVHKCTTEYTWLKRVIKALYQYSAEGSSVNHIRLRHLQKAQQCTFYSCTSGSKAQLEDLGKNLLWCFSSWLLSLKLP